MRQRLPCVPCFHICLVGETLLGIKTDVQNFASVCGWIDLMLVSSTDVELGRKSISVSVFGLLWTWESVWKRVLTSKPELQKCEKKVGALWGQRYSDNRLPDAHVLNMAVCQLRKLYPAASRRQTRKNKNTLIVGRGRSFRL